MNDDLENTTDGVSNEDEAVTALRGLLKAKGNDDIFKAKDSGKDKDDDNGDDKDDDYNESYMKKNMSKFMKNNSGYMKKMGYMKKAVDNAYDVADNDGDLEAEATMVDGTEIFKAFKELSGALLKAYADINERMEGVEAQVAFNSEIAAAGGEVLIKASETLDKISRVPVEKKGQLAGGTSMQKASKQGGDQDNLNTGNAVLQKAVNLGVSGAKKVLYKAAIDGNTNAGKVLTQIESCFGNMGLLPAESLKVIADLAPQD